METTKLFLVTFFASLVGVIPPGLVNMTVARTCLERGKNNGILVAIGASIVVIFQALIAILLAKYIFFNPYVRNILLRTGAVIFFFMAIYFFAKAKQKSTKIKVYRNNDTRSFFKGVMMSAINVLPIPYFCAIAAGMSVSGKIEYDTLRITAFIIAAGAGTFVTLYFYVFSFLKIEKKTASIAKYSNYFMGILMLILVVITLARIIYTWE
ncbi:threonine/homoserine/homoserine lactone efflux protein [Aquimarina sp. EL_43]|uniref:LysE family translocator n=1 Tax=Aquimarina TaxID=290174 RepID=UPI0004718766|nr:MULTISPECIES: LysE family transporter [Aquimarina]MBG6131896.1 threonine/homoserine/homoserine lactone efflux protein [Aquimarina sp. EL_35]MBG6149460.1 threonine/homoserine/homoserine lactone efflux protein [Aquimarina sp. EL_32]MBG6170277.1 threonine/homoserine/homoserine lactone efflux protein [Aquimarina sp. EL_43]